jgi:hypothetical protein
VRLVQALRRPHARLRPQNQAGETCRSCSFDRGFHQLGADALSTELGEHRQQVQLALVLARDAPSR